MPIAGASIIINDAVGNFVTSATTDANGQAAVFLNQGTYTVIVSKSGYVTTQYTIVINNDNTQLDFNLPAPSTASITATVITLGISETVSVALQANMAFPINKTITEAITVVSNTPLVALTLVEAIAVTKTPTYWYCYICRNDTDTSLQAGTISPGIGLQSKTTGATLPVVATTQQFNLYQKMYADGVLQADNSATSNELSATQHSYTFPTQILGTFHLLTICWSAAWEVVVSAGSNGSCSQSGTYEVRSGSAGPSCTGTPNTNYHVDHWALDGQNVSSSGSYSPPTQPNGTTHNLVVYFAHN